MSDINVRKGESECQYYIDKLEFLDDKQRDPLLDECKTLLCHGELRTKSGLVGTDLNLPPFCSHALKVSFLQHFISSSVHLAFQRLHVFLFSELLVLTRPVTRNDKSCFQVYRQPIPVRNLALEDLQDGEIRMGGSFRGAFTNGEKGEVSWTLLGSVQQHSFHGFLQWDDLSEHSRRVLCVSVLSHVATFMKWRRVCPPEQIMCSKCGKMKQN